MASTENIVVTSRDVMFALRWMQTQNMADMTAFAASAPVAGVPFEKWINKHKQVASERPSDNYPFDWDTGGWFEPDKYPYRAGAVAGPKLPNVSVELPAAELGGQHLLRWADASEALCKASARALGRQLLRLRQIGRYKAWVCAQESAKVFGINLGLAQAKLLHGAKAKRKPTFRRHQSRCFKATFAMGKVEVGWKHGRPAYHFPKGRPPLSEAEILAKYHARLAKKRKGKKPGTPRGGLTIYKCKTIPRGSSVFRHKAKTGGGFKFASGITDLPASKEQAKELLKEFVEEAFKSAAEVAGDYVRPAVRKWVEKGIILGDTILRGISGTD